MNFAGQSPPWRAEDPAPVAPTHHHPPLHAVPAPAEDAPEPNEHLDDAVAIAARLAHEINRAMPKTQSALLEAMAERQVTVNGETLRLPDPFLIIATANPVEQEGTFPMPEAQLDRFFLRTALGYPSEEDEVRILD